MKKILSRSIAVMAALAMLLGGCSKKQPASTISETTPVITSVVSADTQTPAERQKQFPTNEIVILYTNDTHSYINNETKDKDGNVAKGLSFASVKALKDELMAEGKTVLLVDAGDHVQGTAYGGMDEGDSIIDIMNKTGYDVATLGNHEFDYGMFRTFYLMDKANYPYVSCNFYSLETNAPVLDPYVVFDVAGVKVAFVGISTPDSITSSTPTYFMDETGTNFIYSFYSGEDGTEMYEAFQAAVDKAREEADFVIGLGHLGDDLSSYPYRSTDLIENITGIDAFIDGHSHSTIEGDLIPDKCGNNVLLSQTGNYFNAIGQMTISTDGSFKSKLVTEVDTRDEGVDTLTASVVSTVDETLGEKIAYLETPLYIVNANNTDERLIRRCETNLGDFVADAVYYYFNCVIDEPIDIAVNNGGGIRANLAEGDLSYMSAKTVAPFGNVMCVIEATGQQILDCLELGSAKVGLTNPETGVPAEFGGFEQVAGIKFSIDTSIASSVVTDENGIWVSGPADNAYRVKDVAVYNRETGEYEPLVLARIYRIGGINYTLRNQGDGMGMFQDSTCVVDYVTQDYLCLSEYMKSFKEVDGVSTINTANSPLSSYIGYLIDYENPLGSGRITIVSP